MEFLYILSAILLASFAISLISNFKAIESIFILINTSIVLMLIMTYISNLTTAVIILCILIGILFIGSILYSIIAKELFSKVKSFFNNPALLILVVSTIGFCIISRGAVVLGHDDLTFWALAPKLLLEFNGFLQPLGIKSIGHPQGLPMYYALSTFFAGLSFNIMLNAKWFLVWVYLLLPFANHEFKSTKIILLYSFIVYSIILTINHSILELYSDIVIYTISACTIAYYYLQHDTKKRNIIAFCALLVLPYIKEVFSIIITIVFLLVFILDKLYKSKNRLNKDDIIFLVLSTISFGFSFLLNKWISSSHIATDGYKQPMIYINSGGNGIDASYFYELKNSLIQTISSPNGIILSVLIIISIVLCYILFIKNSKYTYLSYVTTIVLSILICYVSYSNFSYTIKTLISIVLNYIYSLKYITINLPNLISLIIIIAIAYCIFIIKDSQQRKYFTALCLIFTVEYFVFLIGIIVYKSMKQNFIFIPYFAGITRYIGASIYFIIFLLIMYLLANTKIHNLLSKRTKTFIISTIIIFIMINIAPMPLTLYNRKIDNYNYHIQNFDNYHEANNVLNNNTDSQDNICIIADINDDEMRPGYIAMALNYFANIPNYKIIFLDPDKDNSIQVHNLNKYFSSNNINKVYFFDKDETFDNAFSNLFHVTQKSLEHNLYSVEWIDDMFKLEFIELT